MKITVAWFALLTSLVHAASTTQPAGLPDGYTIVAQASSLDELIRITQPKFVWNKTDFLWITHDAAGHVGFRMNRADQRQLGTAAEAWYLFETGDDWDSPTGLNLRYAEAIDATPQVLARHPEHGVVYAAAWPSNMISGTGHIFDTRTILLLCDGAHHWKLLGEGPIGNDAQCGANEHFRQFAEITADWTGDAERPIKFAFTMADEDHWREDGEGSPEHSLTTRWPLVPGQRPPPGGLRDDLKYPADANDEPPGPFVRTGPYYILADQNEPFDAWFKRAYNHLRFYEIDSTDARKLSQLGTDLRAANPALTDHLTIGTRILLPESLHVRGEYSHDNGKVTFIDTSLGKPGPKESATPKPIEPLQ